MKTELLVGLAGATGAICRIAISELFTGVLTFPIATLAVNLCGTLLLCALSAGAIRKVSSNVGVQTAIMTGFLGSFTTFSAFSYETVTLFQQGAVWIAIFYSMASIFGGLAIGFMGMTIGRKSVGT
ncbi:CrcB family protein [Sporosarcina oncorhynchi]|uniref:Fluoride-specific ion channel FluC n=1 Tax=Sporosarcina oncorhynchi TaxID=3056444 RepID=A0ABZ0L169_9BACL|nr:CrcB family protein [Sporosarcina sp. T2O-4]WOV86365.1 CrcB family protein [Sporosarcina sp. T2O-4]